MDLSRIKQFVKHNGDKFIVMEDEEPELVVMSFKEYEEIVAAANRNGARTELEKEWESDSFKLSSSQFYSDNFPKEKQAFENNDYSESEEEVGSREEVVVEGEELDVSHHHSPVKQVMSHGLPVRLEDIKLEDLPI